MSDFDGTSESTEVSEISESSIDTSGETGGESSIDTQEEIDYEGSEMGFEETAYDSDLIEEDYDESETDEEIGFDEDFDNTSVDDEIYSNMDNFSSDEDNVGFSDEVDDFDDSYETADESIDEEAFDDSDKELDEEFDDEAIDDSDEEFKDDIDDEVVVDDIDDFEEEFNESDETLDGEINDESIYEETLDDSDEELNDDIDGEVVEDDIDDFEEELDESDETLDEEIKDESIEDERARYDSKKEVKENIDDDISEEDAEYFDEDLDESDEILDEEIEDDVDDIDNFDEVLEYDESLKDDIGDEDLDNEDTKNFKNIDADDDGYIDVKSENVDDNTDDTETNFDKDNDDTDDVDDNNKNPESHENSDAYGDDKTDKDAENLELEQQNREFEEQNLETQVDDVVQNEYDNIDSKVGEPIENQDDATDGKEDKREAFKDWINPDSYQDGKYTGNYRPNGMSVEEYNKQQAEKAKAAYAEYLDRQHKPQIEKNDAYSDYTDKLGERTETQHGEVSENKNLEKSYNEYNELSANNQLEHIEKEAPEVKAVNANDIYGVDSSGEHFWEHHDNTKEDYMHIAEKLPEVQEKLDSGMTVEELKKDPELADCVNAYYDPDQMVKVEQFGDVYIFQDDGRHRVAAAQELGYEVPVNVTYEAKSINSQRDSIDSSVSFEKQQSNEIVENTEKVEIEADNTKTLDPENLNDLPPKNETNSKEYKSIVDSLEKEKVEYHQIQLAEPGRTKQDIISKLSGGDETKGSCSSLALAYAGNKAGYEVLDFRDGNSRNYFSSRDSIQKIADMPDIKSFVLHGTNDIATANQLLSGMQNGKEYYLATGGHAAIVRKGDAGYEYLELQHPSNGNGWHSLNDETLRYRFGCNESRTSACSSFLIDVSSMSNSSEFLNVLGFINTAEDKQRKGAIGNVR